MLSQLDDTQLGSLIATVEKLESRVCALDERVRALDEYIRERADPAPLLSAELTAVKLEDVPRGVCGSPAPESLVDLTGGRGKDKKRKYGAIKDRKVVPGSSTAPRSTVEEVAKAFYAATSGKSSGMSQRNGWQHDNKKKWRKIKKAEVAELMKRVSSETAERVNNSKSFKGCFYAVIDRENMSRSGVYPKWLEAEHVKKSAGSGYAKFGTKQESIEGALEELNDMIEHYNSMCSMQKEKQWE